MSTLCQLQCCNGHNSYLSDILWCDRQEVDFICQAFGGLDSCNVWVDQHSLDILFLQSLNSLKNKPNINWNSKWAASKC